LQLGVRLLHVVNEDPGEYVNAVARSASHSVTPDRASLFSPSARPRAALPSVCVSRQLRILRTLCYHLIAIQRHAHALRAHTPRLQPPSVLVRRFNGEHGHLHRRPYQLTCSSECTRRIPLSLEVNVVLLMVCIYSCHSILPLFLHFTDNTIIAFSLPKH
jgi:hypothetical protein